MFAHREECRACRAAEGLGLLLNYPDICSPSAERLSKCARVPRSPAAARQQDEIADPASSRGTCGGVSAVWQRGGKSDSERVDQAQLSVLDLIGSCCILIG